MIKCTYKISDLIYGITVSNMLLYIGKCCHVHAYNASYGGEKKTQAVILLLVTYHIILSIEISFSLFASLYTWVGGVFF